ncbi:MAG: TRM11 family SAM-dependent methyltransferase [Minisyncoccia bacterium]|jgi:DNA modification methylase
MENKIYDIKDCEVYYENGKRKIKCPCGKVLDRSIVKHFKIDHPLSWELVVKDFLKLTEEGFSPQKIIKHYKSKNGYYLFTWSVVENEIKKSINSGVIPIKKIKEVKKWYPDNQEIQVPKGTIWYFPKRGNWAVHSGEYRGNWPPQVPRLLIEKFSNKGDLILDPFLGGGTTVIEAWLLDRKSIGIDINPYAIEISKYKIKKMKEENYKTFINNLKLEFEPKLILGDSLRLSELLKKENIKENSIDLILTHPPYFNSLRYTYKNPQDLSNINKLEDFLNKLTNIIDQATIFLKPKGIFALQIGDVKKNNKIIPLNYYIEDIFFKKNQFELIDIIIKAQFNDKSTTFYVNSENKNKYHNIITHEYIFIFRKY